MNEIKTDRDVVTDFDQLDDSRKMVGCPVCRKLYDINNPPMVCPVCGYCLRCND